jgi:hypothetical protein
MIKDMKWPSTKRRRAAERNRMVWQSLALAAGLNLITYALALLIPAGMWLALIGLVAGTAATTVVAKDIFSGQ